MIFLWVVRDPLSGYLVIPVLRLHCYKCIASLSLPCSDTNLLNLVNGVPREPGLRKAVMNIFEDKMCRQSVEK